MVQPCTVAIQSLRTYDQAHLILAIERTASYGYRRDTGVMVPFVVNCYMLTFFVLVIGAMLQHRFCSRSAYLSTCWVHFSHCSFSAGSRCRIWRTHAILVRAPNQALQRL